MPAPVSISRRCSGRSFRSSSTSGRIASRPRSMMARPPIFTTCSQGSNRIGRPPATGCVSSPSSRVWRASGEATCLMSLVVSAMAMVLSARGDDGADVLAGKRAGQIAGDEAIHDLHLADVASRLEQVQYREFEDRIVQPLGLHLVDRDFWNEGGALRGLRVRGVEAVFVLHIDHRLATELLGDQETSSVGAVGRDDALGGGTYPEAVGRHAAEDDGIDLGEVERHGGEPGGV